VRRDSDYVHLGFCLIGARYLGGSSEDVDLSAFELGQPIGRQSLNIKEQHPNDEFVIDSVNFSAPRLLHRYL
jgi:hypothetical protein